MDFLTALQVSSSALDAQRVKMNTIASNLANAETTRTPEGGPYKKKTAVLTATEVNNPGGFKNFKDALDQSIKGVKVSEITEDNESYKMKYEPGSPDADEKGYVKLPNINLMEEMVNMMSASRAYEANVTAINATKSMAQKALDIGK